MSRPQDYFQSKNQESVWGMTENQLIAFFINQHPGHIYPLLEKKWSWEVQDDATRRKWSFFANLPLKSQEAPTLDLTDIDIFCLNNISPKESVAIQVKKVKVRSDNARDALNRGLGAKVREAADQAGILISLGFPLVSTLFIITIDAHRTRKGGIIWDTIGSKKLDSILNRIHRTQTDHAQFGCIGLYVLLLTESGGHNIDTQGAGGILRIIDPKNNPDENEYFSAFLGNLLEQCQAAR
jgi:hypothetical protein